MYVVWLLVFWRNVLNVSNFYIKCKSILNKGGLFPLCLSLDPPKWLLYDVDNSICALLLFNQWSNCQLLHMTADPTSQSAAWGLLPAAQRKEADGRLLPSLEYRKAGAIHYLEVGTRRRCHLLKDNSVSFHFGGSVSTHFTSILTIATRGGSGTPALSPSAVPSAGSASTLSSPRFHDGTNRCCGFQLP